MRKNKNTLSNPSLVSENRKSELVLKQPKAQLGSDLDDSHLIIPK